MFGSPQDGISKEELKHKLQAMNVVVSDEAVDKIFSMTDLNKNGKLEFSVRWGWLSIQRGLFARRMTKCAWAQEMVKMIMPKDYTRPTWQEVRDKETRDAEVRLGKYPVEHGRVLTCCVALVSDQEKKLAAFVAELPKKNPLTDADAGFGVHRVTARSLSSEQRRRHEIWKREQEFAAKSTQKKARKKGKAKLARWRKPGVRRRLEDPLVAPLSKSMPALHVSRPPQMQAKYVRPSQPVGLSARGIRSGMLRSLNLGAKPTRSGQLRRVPRGGNVDLLPQEKTALHQPPIVPRGGVHVAVVPVFAP